MMRSLADRIRRKLSRVRTQIFSPPPTTAKQAFRRLRDNPRSLVLWLDLIGLSAPGMPEALGDQIQSHDLTRTGVILGFRDELESRNPADWETACSRLEGEPGASVCADGKAEMICLKTIAHCRDAHAEGSDSRDAEPCMQKQWDGAVWPIIQNLHLLRALKLAPGHGRNTEFLRRMATFITLASCFDSMVHFESSVVKAYLHEIARVLRPAGSAFLHHSHYGTVALKSDRADNAGNPIDLTAERIRAFASEAGLEVTFQRLSGLADGWGLEELDAFGVQRRPAGL